MKYIYFVVFAFVILHNQNLSSDEQEITTDLQLTQQTATSPLVVVKFYRPTCPFCIKQAPLYTALANQFADIPFLSFNIDALGQETVAIKMKYKFDTVPHFMIFQGQQSQATSINLMPRGIERARSQSIAKPTPKAISPMPTQIIYPQPKKEAAMPTQPKAVSSMNNDTLKTSLMDLQQKLQNLSEILPTSEESYKKMK